MTDQEWLDKKRKTKYSWASDDQWRCILLLMELESGEHHFSAEVKPYGNGIEYNRVGDLSTYDFSRLTVLVLLAHRDCIRAEISCSGPWRLRISLHARHTREGGEIWDRHPTITQAIAILKIANDREQEK